MDAGFQPSADFQIPELGLVCITVSDQVRFRAMTRKRLLQLSLPEQEQALRTLYAENLKRLSGAVSFCQSQAIRLYRLSSAVFPFSDEPMGEAILEELAADLRQIGERAMAAGIRLVLHPDQFVVLNSDRPEVIANSIKILSAHARLFDWMGLPRSPWALMNIHGGKGDRVERLIQVIRDLPDSIRLRLTLENDEYTYGATEILAICEATAVPMVFDAHHHLIHDRLESYDEASVADLVAASRQTWQVPSWQLVHISNGREFLHDPRHSDYITHMPRAYRNVAWIEIEARQKENAITHLRQTWLPLLCEPSDIAQSPTASMQPSVSQGATKLKNENFEPSTACGTMP
jgi:UV DNA damage endonuclease